MKEKGIETGSVYYPPCHLLPYYLEHYTHKGDLPVAENVLKKVMCLPMHANLGLDDLEYITSSFVSSLNEL
jgi:dTDP-4-amino-4,6-dideoxygalactose transaminase